MPKGKIKVVWHDRGYGYIRPGADGPEVWFHASSVREPSLFRELAAGQEVEYEVQETERGPRARGVRLAGEPAAGASRPAEGQYRFLNPYNFVSLAAPKGGAGPADTVLAAKLREAGRSGTVQKDLVPEVPLMGRCEPPPHDRYLGLSGRIGCTLRALTPLFVSDSHEVKLHGEHRSYEFFKLGGEPAIPATSLRGMVRSLLEAVTNSCVSHLAAEKLSHRVLPKEALGLVPARVEAGDADGLQLRLLTGKTKLRIGSPPDGPQYAAWILQYGPIQSSKNIPGNTPYGRRQCIALNGLGHGSECWALLELMDHPDPRRSFQFWNVTQLAKRKEELPKPSPGQHVARGYLCITNQNIENKHDERFFFHDGNRASVRPVPLEKGACDEYKKIIQDYKDRHRERAGKRKHPEAREGDEPAYSRFILEKRDDHPQPEDLVYAMMETPTKVKYIAPVMVPRVRYEKGIPDLLPAPERLSVCQDGKNLCPACRIFGWVHPKPGKDDERVAYAGRVRFSHATLQHGAGTLPATPLAILSSPKPTTTRFYLKPKNGSTPKTWEAQGGYDGEAVLRGRKMYRHHGVARELEYRRAEGRCDDQNRTVRDALKPGARFEFEVFFENLAPVELGALLWALEMDRRSVHRLGFAKPLGFGSVSVQVESVELLDLEKRYRSLSDDGWRPLKGWQGKCVEKFKVAFARHYGYPDPDFEQMPHVKDIRALLSDPPRGLPVHYPRTRREPDPEGKNFEWFLGNNRRTKYTLPAATSDEGLPLIARDGREL